MLKTDKQKRFKATVLALALAVMPLGAHAAGLGGVTVMSALGQPLRAEIDLTASREEYASIAVRLASSEAFKKAGIEYASALSGIRITPVMRPSGQPFLLVTSDQPFNEPFIDMLVEVNWASGRLVREYTFLLDPPDIFKKPVVTAPVAVPELRKDTTLGAGVPARETFVRGEEARISEARAAVPTAEKPAMKPGAAVPAAKISERADTGGTTRLVQKGDTLAKIANELKPDGVNLDQMLVALFRSNKDVFDAGNMNRLRAGKILNIPDKEAAPAVEPGEARKIVVAQAADFNAYRKKLAALAGAEPAKEDAPKQAAAGKITPKVEDKTSPIPAGKDKLEVSRAEAGKGGKSGARIAAAEEDLIAREKALKEANSRIADLEKNLADLKKLAEMKSAAGAKLQASAAAAKPAEAAKPVPAPVLAVPAQPVQAPKPPENVPPASKPVEQKPVTPPPPPPGFVEANPEIVFGGGGIVAILLGYLGFSAWRRKRKAVEESADNMAVAEPSSNSMFGSTGEQSIDAVAGLPTDFSQDSVAGMAGDEGVDPVAEADVYIAYGRDSQAEEILLEALKTDPTRLAIHLKLLDIYAARKSVQPFESVARDLRGLTGGSGPDWEKAAALGRSIDPANPLYGGAETPAAGGLDMGATMVLDAAAIAANQHAADMSAAQPSAETVVIEMPPPAEEAPVVEPDEEVPAALDFDLDLGADAAPATDEQPPAAVQPAADEVMSLDFDLDLGAAPAVETAAEVPAAPVAEAEPEGQSAGLDFDLGTPDVVAEAPLAEPVVEASASGGAENVAAMDFDFDLGQEAPAEAVPAPAPEPEMPLDLSSISLDLEEAPAVAMEAPVMAEPVMAEPVMAEPAAEAEAAPAEEIAIPDLPVETVVADDPEVATKLELAQAYEEMGDKEGARELLNEVLNEGSPSQQEAARVKLAQLA